MIEADDEVEDIKEAHHSGSMQEIQEEKKINLD